MVITMRGTQSPLWAALWKYYKEHSDKGSSEPDRKVWERAGIGTAGWSWGSLVGLGCEADGRRLTRPRRGRVREKDKIIICPQRSLGSRLRS